MTFHRSLPRLPAVALLVVCACMLSVAARAQYQVLPDKSVARNWSEVLIEALRRDAGQVAVNARNVFHFSVALYDAWAVYDGVAKPYLLGNTIGGFSCPYDPSMRPAASAEAVEATISHAAYRLLRHRFELSGGVLTSYQLFDDLMDHYGLDGDHVSTAYETDGSPASLGNYIGECVIGLGLADGSNEAGRYAALNYQPVNPPLDPTDPDSIDQLVDPDRWQKLFLALFVTKTGGVLSGSPDFETPEWGRVTPFAMTEADRTVHQRDGIEYWVYHDPGKPPLISSTDPDALPDEYRWGHTLVAVWTGHLDPSVGHGAELIDISPASLGNNQELPQTIPGLRDYYFFLGGGDSSRGHDRNPATGAPYEAQIVPLGDYARVLIQYWADGPFTAETPAGFMMGLLNDEISDAPGFEKRLGGSGPVLDDLEWDVKAYFALSGATHDAAVAAWSVKGWYDYVRPITAVRYMASKGQSSDPDDPDCAYDPHGIMYVDDPSDPAGDGSGRVIDCVRLGDPLDGAGANVGKIKVLTWRGPDAVASSPDGFGGVGWVLAENWWPMMRPNFVTPPFAGYVSGHSTVTRAGAEALTRLTGSPYFPSGMYEYSAQKNTFLVYETGPSVDVTLQWATYYDVADAAAISRIWGGVHPPVDDITGRRIGRTAGAAAFDKAKEYFGTRSESGGGSTGWLAVAALAAALGMSRRRLALGGPRGRSAAVTGTREP